MNNVILMGRICSDIAEIAGGKGVAFTVAVRRNYKEKDGTYASDFIRCTAWNYSAKFVKDYFAKGEPIAVKGSWMTGSYTGANGETVYTNVCNCSEVSFVVQRPKATQQAPQPAANPYSYPAPPSLDSYGSGNSGRFTNTPF